MRLDATGAIFRVAGARTLNQLANSTIGKAAMALEYGLFRNGPLSMAPSQLGIFSRSDDSVETPDLEYHIQPLSTDKLGDPLHPFPRPRGSSGALARWPGPAEPR